MLHLPQRVLAECRTVFRKAIAKNEPLATVSFDPIPGGVVISARSLSVRVDRLVDGNFSSDPIVAPIALVRDFDGRGSDNVQLSVESDRVVMEWTESGIVRRRRFPIPDPSKSPHQDPPLDFHVAGDGSLWQAFVRAGNCTAKEGSRYALHHLQLRGHCGEIVATDGKQLLTEGGFKFPFNENILIPRCALFSYRDIAASPTVDIARTDKHVVFRAGVWRIWLTADTESRFPDTDTIVPNPSAAKATITLDTDDAEYLSNALGRLVPRNKVDQSVEVEFGDRLLVRVPGPDDDPPTELVISRSHVEGEPFHFHSAGELVTHAAQLGFLSWHFFGAGKPILATDGDQRRYVWMPLTKEERPARAKPAPVSASTIATPVMPASTAAQSKDVSDDRIAPADPVPQETTKGTSMTSKTNETETASRDQNGTDGVDCPLDLIQQAEHVRQSLRDATAKVSDLIASLKQQRRQVKAVQATLQSLRQLDKVA